MKNTSKNENFISTSISVNTDKSQYETHDNDEVIVITPMEKTRDNNLGVRCLIPIRRYRDI